jgi:hypothetical protein
VYARIALGSPTNILDLVPFEAKVTRARIPQLVFPGVPARPPAAGAMRRADLRRDVQWQELLMAE